MSKCIHIPISGSYPRDSASASVTKIAGEEGLTAWRMISDLPHYKLISDLEEDKERAVKTDSFLAKLSKGFVLKWNRGSSRDKDGIYQLKLSPGAYFNVFLIEEIRKFGA